MNKIIKLEIPFGNKPYLKSKNEKNLKEKAIEGCAFYILDMNLNECIGQYIQLNKCSFRVTDKDHILGKNGDNSGTSWYKDWKDFRSEFIDPITKIDPNKMQVKERKYFQLNESQILTINEALMKESTTTLRLYSIFSGSNTSGAETSHKSCPIKCIDTEFYDCNFSNPINKFFNIKKTNWQKDKYINKKIETLDLKMLLREYPEFNKVFLEYNTELYYSNKYEYSPISLNHDEKQIDNIIKTIKSVEYNYRLEESQELFINSITNELLKNGSSDKIKNRLRAFYASNVKKAIKNNYINTQSLSTKNWNEIIQNCHIIPFTFNENFKKNDIEIFKMMINPYNCLRIDANIHILFDKGVVKFNINGDLLKAKDNSLIQKAYLDIGNLANQTLSILKYWIEIN